MPLIVLSADAPLADVVPRLIDEGGLPADTPWTFGITIDRANRLAQARLLDTSPTPTADTT